MSKEYKFNENLIGEEGEIDLNFLFNILWHSKIKIILITFAFAVCSVFYSLSLTNHFKSFSLLSVGDDSSKMSSLSSYGGLASMAGINLPSSSNEQKAIQTVQIISSRAFFKNLLSYETILESVVAAESFNKTTNEIIFNDEIFDPKENRWVWEREPGQSQQPTYLEAFDYYEEALTVSYEQLTGLVSISYEHISPVFAKEFLELIIRDVNEIMRNKDLKESQDALDFLRSELPKSPIKGVKDSMNSLIEAQLEKQMMAKISTEYILKTLEPPYVPIKKSKPQRAVICIIGTVLGGVISLFYVLFNHLIIRRSLNYPEST